MFGIFTSVVGLSVAANLVLLAPMPEDLVDRIRGQSSDLAWSIEVLELSETQKVSAWEALKSHPRHQEFDMAAWVETSIDATQRLSIYDLRSGRFTVKSLAIHGPRSAAERSANFETLALLLRGHLKTFSLTKQQAPARITLAEPAPVTAPKRLEKSMWFSQIAISHHFRGFRDYGTPGLSLALGRDGSAWAWDLSLFAQLSQRDADQYSTLELQHYGGKWTASHYWLKGDWARFAGQLRLGVDAYYSRLEFSETRLTPGGKPWVLAGKTGLGLAWDLPFFGVNDDLGIQISGGADLVWGAPEYLYARENTTEVRNRLFLIQPYLGLGLHWGKKK